MGAYGKFLLFCSGLTFFPAFCVAQQSGMKRQHRRAMRVWMCEIEQLYTELLLVALVLAAPPPPDVYSRAFPGGFHVGGGVNPSNAMKYLDAGASHVIVTSYVFKVRSASCRSDGLLLLLLLLLSLVLLLHLSLLLPWS